MCGFTITRTLCPCNRGRECPCFTSKEVRFVGARQTYLHVTGNPGFSDAICPFWQNLKKRGPLQKASRECPYALKFGEYNHEYDNVMGQLCWQCRTSCVRKQR